MKKRLQMFNSMGKKPKHERMVGKNLLCRLSHTYLWARCLGPRETEKAVATYKSTKNIRRFPMAFAVKQRLITHVQLNQLVL